MSTSFLCDFSQVIFFTPKVAFHLCSSSWLFQLAFLSLSYLLFCVNPCTPSWVYTLTSFLDFLRKTLLSCVDARVCMEKVICQNFSTLARTIPLLCLFFPVLLFLSLLILMFSAFKDSSPVPITWSSHVYTKDDICLRTEWEGAAVVETGTESFISLISVCHCWCDLDEDITSKFSG